MLHREFAGVPPVAVSEVWPIRNQPAPYLHQPHKKATVLMRFQSPVFYAIAFNGFCGLCSHFTAPNGSTVTSTELPAVAAPNTTETPETPFKQGSKEIYKSLQIDFFLKRKKLHFCFFYLPPSFIASQYTFPVAIPVHLF